MRARARGIVVRYGHVTAVDRVDVPLEPGAVTVVVGGDGAGKSSLLRVLAGAQGPSEGDVEIPSAEFIGYVPAGPGMYADLTVDENLDFAASAYGVSPSDAAARRKTLLDGAGLSEFQGRLGGKLSGGMRRKLALITALVHQPDLLVLDEPTTGIDPVSRTQLWRLIARAASDGAIVVVATSYVDEAARAAHLIVLDDGRAILAGTPDQVLRSVPGNVFDGRSRPQGFASWRRGRRWRAWSPDGRDIPGAERVSPDFEDAVVVAALAGAEGRERGRR
jgi:ABC-2 type transport system ATP-binding protein